MPDVIRNNADESVEIEKKKHGNVGLTTETVS